MSHPCLSKQGAMARASPMLKALHANSVIDADKQVWIQKLTSVHTANTAPEIASTYSQTVSAKNRHKPVLPNVPSLVQTTRF